MHAKRANLEFRRETRDEIYETWCFSTIVELSSMRRREKTSVKSRKVILHKMKNAMYFCRTKVNLFSGYWSIVIDH